MYVIISFVSTVLFIFTTPIEFGLARWLNPNGKTRFVEVITPFVGWSWLTPTMLLTSTISGMTYLIIAEDPVWKTIFEYNCNLIGTGVSYAIFGNFQWVGLLLYLTMFFIALSYKILYVQWKTSQIEKTVFDEICEIASKLKENSGESNL